MGERNDRGGEGRYDTTDTHEKGKRRRYKIEQDMGMEFDKCLDMLKTFYFQKAKISQTIIINEVYIFLKKWGNLLSGRKEF